MDESDAAETNTCAHSDGSEGNTTVIGLFVFSTMQILSGRWLNYGRVRGLIVGSYVVKANSSGRLIGAPSNISSGAPRTAGTDAQPAETDVPSRAK